MRGNLNAATLIAKRGGMLLSELVQFHPWHARHGSLPVAARALDPKRCFCLAALGVLILRERQRLPDCLKCSATEDIVNRRQFLQAGLFSSGCVLAGYRSVRAAPTQQKPKIVIIGAGLSGLASAWELRKKGLDVVILEATKRVGGRVLTDRDNFLDGQYTEHGATLNSR